MTRPDLSHIDTWLFDLDNTLYPAESGFMGEVEGRMTAFVAKVTGLPMEEAYGLQKKYLAEHGLTLKGLMLHHGVDPGADLVRIGVHIAIHASRSRPPAVTSAAVRRGRRHPRPAARALQRCRVAQLSEQRIPP